jgi:serine/threonine protein kinase
MLKALYYCHKTIKVIHRDIKPDNIMVNHNNEAVLIDFGVSALVDDQDDDLLGNNMGSYIFYAPEMFLKTKDSKVRGEMTDLWALGVTLYYLLCGRYPAHEAKNLMDLKECITNQEVNFDFIKDNGALAVLKTMLVKDAD